MNISGPSAPAVDELPRLLKRRVISVIEPDSDPAIVALGRGNQPIEFRNGARGGFLDSTCFPASTAAIATGVSASLVVATMTISTSGRSIASSQRSQCDRSGTDSVPAALARCRYRVGARDQPGAFERGRTLAADQPATDDRNTERPIQRSPQVNPRSFGTIRRSV